MSNATRKYMNPGHGGSGFNNEEMAILSQSAAAFSMSGVLPWQLPAGEVGIAAGGEWRMERHCICVLDQRGLLGMYPAGNLNGLFFGKQHVEEGFLEVAAPLLKDQIVQTLTIDLAGRMTSYSNSGLVETWKAGLNSQISDDVRIRMTWSYDIRAPNTWDLFNPGGLAATTCPSFIVGPSGSNGGLSNQCFSVSGGNPDLQPEKANTLAAGVILTPTFLPGLTASVDWYQIHMHGAIASVNATDTILRCQSGELVYCSQIVFRDQGGFLAAKGCGAAGNTLACAGGDTNSQIQFVRTQPVNAALLSTAGFDFAIAYGFDLFTGNMDVGFNGNYVYDFSRTLQGISFQGAGCTNCYYAGGAKFRGNLNLDYREGPWSFGVQARITGESEMDFGTMGIAGIVEQRVTYTRTGGADVAQVGPGQRNPITGAETNYNAIVVTTDLRVQYRWSNNITLFAALDNVQDLPTSGNALRRSYRAGLRFNY